MIKQRSPHYFLALELSTQLKEKLTNQQHAIQSLIGQNSYKSWTGFDDYHITLAFFGALNDNQKRLLIDRFASLETRKTFSVRIGALGYFGNQERPRVIWVKVERSAELLALLSAVQHIMTQLNFQVDQRRFVPHITLAKQARYDQINLKLWSEISRLGQNDWLEWIEAVVLYRIESNRTPKYYPEARFRLKG
ncbi:RNA 2',3'-cyclic phosphodiesterase [Amphibacillus sediminis]|uniref:RNA 2',3'-cyclic phosphodiesterase n=1 Tax=Amphibacillus sediminis TaxID=360185 RepID=UPI000836B701|nr:RNA 2',3'-cyclic phosphodiesterase [Amphibacillus sediminis]